MVHVEHKEFSSGVLKEVCNKALETLPAINENETWEKKAEIALEHLKTRVLEFCGVEQHLFYDEKYVNKLPRFARLIFEIADLIDFDVIHHHGPFTPFRKGEIISKYVVDAVGEKP
jgi:hypothetical protein